MNYLVLALVGLVDPSPLPQAKPNSLKIALNITFAIIGAIAIMIIVLSGMRLVFARDNPENITRNRNAVIYAIIGLVITFLAAAIVNLIIGKLNDNA